MNRKVFEVLKRWCPKEIHPLNRFRVLTLIKLGEEEEKGRSIVSSVSPSVSDCLQFISAGLRTALGNFPAISICLMVLLQLDNSDVCSNFVSFHSLSLARILAVLRNPNVLSHV